MVVNGWADSTFKRLIKRAIYWTSRLGAVFNRQPGQQQPTEPAQADVSESPSRTPRGTFVAKEDATWLKVHVGVDIPLEIRVWRSVNVRFLRTFIHPHLGGRGLLALIYWLEERFPHYCGEHGVYPLIILRKP